MVVSCKKLTLRALCNESLDTVYINKFNDKYTNTNGCLSNKVANDNSVVISLPVVAKSDKVGVTFSNIETSSDFLLV